MLIRYFTKEERLRIKFFFEAFFGLNSYGFELVPTDDNRLVFNREFFGHFIMQTGKAKSQGEILNPGGILALEIKSISMLFRF